MNSNPDSPKDEKIQNVLIILLIIGFYIRIQQFAIGMLFYENNAFRTFDKYVPQLLSNNVEGIKYSLMGIWPVIVLYYVLKPRIDKKYENILKVAFLILLLIILDLVFYSFGGFSVIRFIANHKVIYG